MNRGNQDLEKLRAHPAFTPLKQRAIAITGMSFYADRDDTLAAAVARRMSALSLADARGYLERLDGEAAAEEREALTEELTIGETYFLRHAAQWSAFTDRIIPDILARNQALRRLAIWSAGCSTGAEPYTAAILLRDQFAEQLEGWDVSILGTDINRRFLGAARQARFGAWSFRATPDDLRDRCFAPVDGHWELKRPYRQGVEFQHHNLVRDRIPPGLRPDLILCRNVFIYFDAETNARIVQAFHKALPEGGWLLVGHAEPDMRTFRDFDAVMLSEAVLYRKPVAGEVTARRPTPRPAPAPAAPIRPRADAAPDGRRVARTGPGAVRRPAAPPLPPVPVTPDPVEAAPPLLPVSAAAPPEGHEVTTLMSRGDWTAATAACVRWLEREPLDPWVHVCLGLLHEQGGRAEQAMEAYRRAVYLDRTALIAHYQLGCLLRGRDPAAARRRFRNVLDIAQALSPGDAVRGAPGLTAEELRQAALTQMTRLEGS